MYYILRVGNAWRDLPKEFGPWSSVYTRFRRWCRIGLWQQMFRLFDRGGLDSILCVDATHIKVHQDGSNAAGGRESQAIGKTKGGLNTKLTVAVDYLGRAIALSLSPANRNDVKSIEPIFNALRDAWVVGDRGFDSAELRQRLIRQNAKPCIPPRCNRRIQYQYSQLLYAHRHVVENYFARIKRNRRIATRYEKLAETFLGFVTLASILDWLHFEV